MTGRRERLVAWDRALVQAVGGVRMLGTLSWDPLVAEHWMAHRALPQIELRQPDLGDAKDALTLLATRVDRQDPLGAFLGRTIDSYLSLLRLLGAQGSPGFTQESKALFGQPTDRIHPGAATHLEAARHFLEETEDLPIPDPVEDMDAEQAQGWLEAALEDLEDPLPVEVSSRISSKATAGARRIRLRKSARFSTQSLQQLLVHEARVHAYTKRNGLDQPLITAMGLSSPRTLRDQEGLATFAELITDAMDHRRLRRIALRVVGVHAALEGADFEQVVVVFEDGGQSPIESYQSAARIFRGGDGRGGVVFTKDTVYLAGLMRVHTFLVHAFRSSRLELPVRLFAGRWTLGDARDLEQAFEEGLLAEPTRVPGWARAAGPLAAYLSWASFHGGRLLPCQALSDL